MERTTDPAGPAPARRTAGTGHRGQDAGVRPDAAAVPSANLDGDGKADSQARDAEALEGPPDRDLVQQVIEGRREAFDDLIRRYQRQAVAVSYRLLGNSQDALEVT